MRSICLALLLLFATPVLADSSMKTDVSAAGIVERAGLLTARNSENRAASSADRELIKQQLRAISVLEVEQERGLTSISPILWRELEVAREALMAIPVAIIVDQRGPPSLGTISGTITATGGAPLENASVQAREFSLGSPVFGAGIISSASTDASGNYTLTMPVGNYVVKVNASGATPASATGYTRRAYDDLACDNFATCPGYAGTVVPLASGGAVVGIDLEIPVGGAISGTVTRASDAALITDGRVNAQDESGSVFASGQVAADGTYTIVGLPAGNYRVYAEAFTPSGLMAETRGDMECSPSDCEWLPAPLVAVTVGNTVSGMDFALQAAGTLSGVVEDEASAPISNASIALYSEDGYLQQFGTTDASGNYRFEQLRSGNYRIVASAPANAPVTFAQVSQAYGPIAYPNRYCPSGGCNPMTSGDAIAFTAGVDQALAAMTLPAFGTISGQIRDAATNDPIEFAQIGVSDAAGLVSAGGITDVSGNYQIGGLPPGNYFVLADARRANYLLTYNGDVVCPVLGCENLGVPVALTASAPGNAGTADLNLQTGGQITGEMFDQQTGAPALNFRTRLELFGASNERYVNAAFLECLEPTVSTLVSCSYTAAGLAPGTYKGVFASSSVIGLQDTAFGGSFCPRGGCDQSALPPLFATTGGTLSGIDVTFPRGALIRGRVTDAASGAGPECRPYDIFSFNGNASFSCGAVGVNNALDNYAGFAIVDRRGDYFVRTGFPVGATLYASTFLLRNNFSFGFGYVDQAYDGLNCPFGSCGITNGTGVTVVAGDVTGVDMALIKGGSIGGQITASAGATPLPGVQVLVYTATGRQAGASQTDLNGDYRVYGLSPANYFVTTSNAIGFLDEVYDDIVCEPFCNPVGGMSVAVSGTTAVAGINFALDLSASIDGIVRFGGSPTASVGVELYGAIGNLLRSTISDASGGYAFSGLPAGRYFVRTRDSLGRADALFSGFPCVGDACQVRDGTPIDLAPPGTASATADLDMTAPASISGTVTSVPGGSQVSGVRIQLLADTGAVALTTTTNGAGSFSFNGLAGGTYYMVTRGTPGLIDVAYPNAPCPEACNGLNGSAIPLTAGVALGGQDFALSTGGAVSGSVQSGPSAPVVGATVQIFSNSGVPVGQISTNASGNYQVDTLPSGNYFVRTQQSLGFVDQVFNALPCSGYCDLLSGTPVPVSAGTGTGLVDFTLTGGGSISGRVSNVDSGTGIALARVVAFDTGGFIAGQAQADASGDYSIAGLQPGSYRLRSANLSGFVNEVYLGSTCSPTPCSVAAGAPIVVAGAAVTGIDFALTPGSTISGTAADTFNNPLPSGTAVLLDVNGIEVAMAPVSNGVWEFNGLADGTYFVLIRNTSGLVDLLYANVICPAGACDIPALGTPIVLAVNRGGGGASNIDLRLPVGQTISGTIRDAGSNNPLNDVTVYLFDASGAVAGQAHTDALGEFVSDGSLPDGDYFAATANGSQRGAGQGYVNALFSGQNCLLDCDVTSGTTITIAATSATGVDFNLSSAGLGVTGTVRNGNAQPLQLIDIEIYTAGGELAGAATTNSQGVYSIDGLPTGNYFARTRNNVGLADRLFGGGACDAGCDPLTGLPIPVPVSAQIGNIDFVLVRADPLFDNGFE